jgi:peptidoglycan/LPS O-acetylase OafA/YrhL
MSDNRFRPYVEGLRALAIVLVLLFHSGLPVKGGFVGVDIFFVISGFLITGLLLREIEATGSVSLLNFYARRAKRLLPASCLVLACTALAISYLAPASKKAEFGWDVVAAAAYFVNFRFAQRSVDYLAEDLGRSPVLHFWSLAVEEQFYFIWPVLLLASVVLAKRTRWGRRWCATALLLVVFLPSLVWSIVHTRVDPSASFFETPTRLWELGLGALLAVGLPWVERVAVRFATSLAAVGWLLVLLAIGLFDANSVWPGWSALVPTVGTVLLIASGSIDPHNRLLKPLVARPAVALGGLSYSLYLWHWPFIVVGMDFLDLEGWKAGVLLIAASVVPAVACHKFIENRFRFSARLAERPTLALSLGLTLSMLALFAGILIPLSLPKEKSGKTKVTLRVRSGRVFADPADFGAGGLTKKSRKGVKSSSKQPLSEVSPAPVRATRDLPSGYALGCQTPQRVTDVHWCPIGDANGAIDVAVVGDSKILQYFDALDAVGKALGWKIRTATKSACPFSAAEVPRLGKPYVQCQQYNELVLAQLLKDTPDLVITSQNLKDGRFGKNSKGYTVKGMAEGLVKYWSALERKGAHVIVVLDNPNPMAGRPVYDCVGKKANNYEKCTFAKEAGIARSAVPAQLLAKKLFDQVNIVDLSDYICPGGKCSPVINGALVYRQTSHLTNTYALTVGPVLAKELEAAAFKADPKLASRSR